MSILTNSIFQIHTYSRTEAYELILTGEIKLYLTFLFSFVLNSICYASKDPDLPGRINPIKRLIIPKKSIAKP